MQTPQIVNKPALSVVGLEAAFISVLAPDATNAKVIGPLWDRFVHRAHEVPQRIGHEMYGVVHARPAAQRGHPHECQYLAGVAVSSADTIPEGMVTLTVPAGLFAVFTHRGPISKIGVTVAEIYRVWLPQSGHQHAHIADVELYDRRFHLDRDDSEMEIWISVTPAAR